MSAPLLVALVVLVGAGACQAVLSAGTGREIAGRLERERRQTARLR
jgi:hypothetical protein